MATHTTGPWSANGAEIFGGGLSVARATIHVNESPTRMGEIDANARLIAAAPDLLAAGRAMLKQHENIGCKDCMAMLAAIARAEGR